MAELQPSLHHIIQAELRPSLHDSILATNRFCTRPISEVHTMSMSHVDSTCLRPHSDDLTMNFVYHVHVAGGAHVYMYKVGIQY
jgi:hypothetical protein